MRLRSHRVSFPAPRHFTLIELLVVVAIISVLAAMLLPALSSARTVAKISLCLANKKQLYSAMAMYVSDSDDSLPSQGETNVAYIASTWNGARWHSEQNPQQGDPTCRYYAWGKLWPGKYFGAGEVLYCTDNDLITASGARWSSFRGTNSSWVRADGQNSLDVAGNASTRFVLSGAAWASPWFLAKETNVAPTAIQMPFMEANHLDRRRSDRTFFTDISFGGAAWAGSSRPAVPHGKRGVVRAAADGHAGILKNPWPSSATDFGTGHPWEVGQPQGQGLGVQTAIMTSNME